MPIRAILVPTDFSPDAERALQWAIELARPQSAIIHLLHCCFVGPRFSVLPEPLPVPADLWTQLRAQAFSQLVDLEKKVAAAGLTAQSRLCEQPPLPAITEYAASRSIDVIVMGTRGKPRRPERALARSGPRHRVNGGRPYSSRPRSAQGSRRAAPACRRQSSAAYSSRETESSRSIAVFLDW
jgi:nucleotide-binding universal stress UspA family protein